MKPQNVSEQMMYNTVRISTESGCGTGSFFNFKVDGYVVPVIITNQHVINYNENELTTFEVHIKDSEEESTTNLKVAYSTKWIFHNDKDICFCYANPLFEEIRRIHHKEVFYIANDESLIYSKDKLEELSVLEELVMVGYPIGLWDSRNNFPIFRKGYTSSHPAIDFNEDGIGLIDMACLPGSSGSPIYILNEGGYTDKNGNTYSGQSRLILIGFLVSGPQYTADGELIVKNIPTKQTVGTSTKIMANLGYYIKANEILKFRSQIIGDLKSENTIEI